MKLAPFDEMPHIEGEHVILREMCAADAPALAEFARSEAVYRLLPTFLYEHKYDDAAYAIEHMRAECFDTKESILLAICLREAPDALVGIAEIYALEEGKPKVSIGYRIAQPYWGRGIATEVVSLLKGYLLDQTTTRTITAHVMEENVASARALAKNGFLPLFTVCVEDWGRDEPVLVDKYVFKRRWLADNAS